MQVRAEQVRKNFPLVVAGVVIVVVAGLLLSKPKADKRNAGTGSTITVEVLEIQASSITPKVLSYGLVEPRTRSNLVAQVSGRVESISEQFRDGGFFRQGELLLQIDATDYEIEVDVVQASLAEAEQGLAEELNEVEQAKADWSRLGNKASARPLVLRKPQLKAAEAKVNSAKAQLRKAKVNLARTSIQAPFDGRVLSTSIDLGQVASNNAVLGDIYATDAVEVRLPIKNDDLPLLDLPEDYRHLDQPAESLPAVRIRSELAMEEIWQGNVIRTAGSIDDSSRQLYVVARIDDPFGRKAEGRFPLKIGQYVTAEIDGITMQSAISIPTKAIYQGSYVYLHREGAVYRTPINIGWQNGELAIVSSGINAGDQLVVSPLGQVTSGTPVKMTTGSVKNAETEREVDALAHPGDDEEGETDKGSSKGAAR
jgi:RND family efflux transporter MFP subunit